MKCPRVVPHARVHHYNRHQGFWGLQTAKRWNSACPRQYEKTERVEQCSELLWVSHTAIKQGMA